MTSQICTQMRKVWNENTSDRMRGMLYNSRSKAKENVKKQLGREATNLEMVGMSPKWMSMSIWNKLVEKYWAKYDCIQKFKQAQKNRMTEKYGSVTKHTCGSIPLEAYRQTMETILKQNVNNFAHF